MSQHPQPAAELIANALAKIKKLAGNKKHAELSERCQQLIDSIHEVSWYCAAESNTRQPCMHASTTPVLLFMLGKHPLSTDSHSVVVSR